MRRSLALLALAGLVACENVSEPLAPPSPTSAEHLLSPPGGPTGQLIPGRFLVTVREEHDALGVALAHGITPQFVYDNVLHGFAGSIPDAVLAVPSPAGCCALRQIGRGEDDRLRAEPPASTPTCTPLEFPR